MVTPRNGPRRPGRLARFTVVTTRHAADPVRSATADCVSTEWLDI